MILWSSEHAAKMTSFRATTLDRNNRTDKGRQGFGGRWAPEAELSCRTARVFDVPWCRRCSGQCPEALGKFALSLHRFRQFLNRKHQTWQIKKPTNLTSLVCLRYPLPLAPLHVLWQDSKNGRMSEKFLDKNKNNNTNEWQYQPNNQQLVGCGDGLVALRMTQWGVFWGYSHVSKTKEGRGLKMWWLCWVIGTSLVDLASCHGGCFFDRSVNV
jgi:hypothetical protein